MKKQWSLIFLTELILLLLISQLFWPWQAYVQDAFIRNVCLVVQWGVVGSSLLLLPGRRWSYLFFSERVVTSRERVAMSMAISAPLIVFTGLYLVVFGAVVTTGILICWVTAWILCGMIVGLFAEYRRG